MASKWTLWLGCMFVLALGLNQEAQGSPEDHCITVDKRNKKIVCVCNKDHCDDFQYEWPQKAATGHLISSTREGKRFRVADVSAKPLPEPDRVSRQDRSSASVQGDNRPMIYVDLYQTLQTILGWGGAFTDSNGLNIQSLSKPVGDKIIESYYSEKGLEYTFGRVHIGGCDFSTREYSLDDTQAPDYELGHWALQHEDLQWKIPTIKQALTFTQRRNVSLNLFGSSWSPPAWMKTNHNLTRGHLINDDRVYRSYANYLIKWYEAYRERGIRFWGGTVQNEPLSANSPGYGFNSLQMDNNEMIKFVGHFLGPALEAKNYTRDNFKLMVGDDNLVAINGQVPQVLASAQVRKYVSGLAFHWYNSNAGTYDSLLDLHHRIKDSIDFMLMTEACNGIGGNLPHVDLGSWERGENYATDIIEDLLRLANGWIDWNFCVDPNGGPNWARDFVDSAIIVDKSKDEFYKQPMFYVMGHFSKFFKPGAKRILSWLKGQKGSSDGKLMAVAAIKEDTKHLLVAILNKYDVPKNLNVTYLAPTKLRSGLATMTNVNRYVELNIEPRSINTLVIKIE